MEYDPTKLRTRMSPYGLCSFLPSISDEQKKDITELGFAFLLTLRVDNIPSRLARWLVENFDTCKRVVKLASNDELRISEEDVYLTMGFPRGSKPIQEAKKSHKGEYARVLDERKAQWAEILTNCSKLGIFKDTTGPSQTQPGDANVGHQATPSSQDNGLFASDPSFWDACVELAKTYKKTSGIAFSGTFTPPGFNLGFGFRLSQSV
ncbi:hypothetical protein Cgig2_025000 [Carnegiea gigantea]|uniref:Uncharacterized protein n=1 Tax=Carnegiea gigantea TaxID=171969 RepID=A0A9Q1JRA4_9CARY|nr:hypothetical protein Cgig2_025000 [Carnegiea gigantea]